MVQRSDASHEYCGIALWPESLSIVTGATRATSSPDGFAIMVSPIDVSMIIVRALSSRAASRPASRPSRRQFWPPCRESEAKELAEQTRKGKEGETAERG